MKKESSKIFSVNFWFSYFLLLLFLAVRSEFPFVDDLAFKGLSVLLACLIAADTVFAFVLKHLKKLKKAAKIAIIVKFVLLAAVLALYGIVYYYIKYYLVEYAYLLLYTLPVVFVLSLIFGKKRNTAIAFILCGIFMIAAFLSITKIMPSGFKVGPVVYAVGDEYQIVWSTYNRGISYVEIGEDRFYDSTAGRANSELTVHKVSVPMALLDNAKSYTVFTKNMLLRNAYSALQGKTISGSYSFRPVDENDGIQYFALSDTHDYKSAAVKAASYFGEKLDFLIVAGDISSFVPRDFSLEFINKLAFDITKGGRPVIFARGNHETRGNASTKLDNYVGAESENSFYYTFRLGSLWGVVLDTAEDKEDADWEYYGGADYESYRQKQTLFLDGIIANADEEYNAPGITYRIAVSHISTAFAVYDTPFTDTLNALTERLNQMDIDIMVSGHRHNLMYLEGGQEVGNEYFYTEAYAGSRKDRKQPDIITTGANFSAAVVSSHSHVQLFDKPAPFTTKFSGAAFEYSDGKLTLKYINDKGEALDTISPWFDISYGKEITVKTFS